MPSKYKNPSTIHQHNQDQQRSIECRQTAGQTQDHQQAEDTAPNHHRDNPAPLVPFYLVHCCMFSIPSLTFQAPCPSLVGHFHCAPLLLDLSAFAAKFSRTPPR